MLVLDLNTIGQSGPNEHRPISDGHRRDRTSQQDGLPPPFPSFSSSLAAGSRHVPQLSQVSICSGRGDRIVIEVRSRGPTGPVAALWRARP